MATRAIDGERFDLGRVISRAGGAISRNLTLFALLALILQFLPALLIRGYNAEFVPPPVPGALPSFGAPTILSSLLAVALYYVMQAAVTHITVVDLKGDKPTLGPALRRGFSLILPLFGLAIVVTFGLMLGMLLLIIPGIILAVMWSVAAPVMVEEQTGVFASLGRSRALTKGARWSIFLLGLAMFFALGLVSGGTLLASGGLDPVAIAESSRQFGITAIITTLVNTVIVVVGTTLIAAVYIELRFVREGVGPEGLAAVFD